MTESLFQIEYEKLIKLTYPNPDSECFEPVFEIPPTDDPNVHPFCALKTELFPKMSLDELTRRLLHFVFELAHLDTEWVSRNTYRTIARNCAITAGLIDGDSKRGMDAPLVVALGGPLYFYLTLQGLVGRWLHNYMAYLRFQPLYHNLRWRVAIDLFYVKAIANFMPDADPDIPKDATQILFNILPESESKLTDSYRAIIEYKALEQKLNEKVSEARIEPIREILSLIDKSENAGADLKTFFGANYTRFLELRKLDRESETKNADKKNNNLL